MAVAACSVVLYVDSVVNSMIYGLVDSMQPAISYCYGANLQKRVWAIEKRVLTAGFSLSIGTLFLMYFGGGELISLFVQKNDQELLTLSLHAMRLFSLSYLVGWVDACISSYLTALDCPGRSLIVSFCGTLVFPLIALSVLAPIWKLDGVWCMPFVAGIASAIVAVIAVVSMSKIK